MRPTIIGIAGGTASGKTTIAKILYEKTKEFGTVSLIRMDDYYKRRPCLAHIIFTAQILEEYISSHPTEDQK